MVNQSFVPPRHPSGVEFPRCLAFPVWSRPRRRRHFRPTWTFQPARSLPDSGIFLLMSWW